MFYVSKMDNGHGLPFKYKSNSKKIATHSRTHYFTLTERSEYVHSLNEYSHRNFRSMVNFNNTDNWNLEKRTPRLRDYSSEYIIDTFDTIMGSIIKKNVSMMYNPELAKYNMEHSFEDRKLSL